MSLRGYKCLIILLLLSNFSLFAQTREPYTLSTDSMVNYYASQIRKYWATRIGSPPEIDGELNDPCWETGTWFDDFIQQRPLQAAKPSQKTEFKILYNDSYLFVAFKCYDDEPEKIRSTLSRRDNHSGDKVGIAFDSYFDKQTAFEFNLTAAGQKIDLMHLGAYGFDINWDAVWEGKSVVKDSMWTVEFKIPLSQLRFSTKAELVWGMHVVRWIDRLNEEDEWKLVPIDAPAMVFLFGELHGINNLKHKRNFEFLPYLRAGASPNSELENKTDFGVGIDGKIGITSDFTLDYTINPDFGQLEVDPSVLNLTSYEVFYDEKRPFFLEGKSVLDYKMEKDMLFYSRRIGHSPSYSPTLEEGETMSVPVNTSILSALKVTGKNKKGLSLGVIQSFTQREKATIYSDNDQTLVAVEPFTSYFVGRIKQDFNNGNTVLGGMVTSAIRNIQEDHLDFLPKSSLSAGLDFEHNWKNRKYFLDMKGFFSKITGNEDAISLLQNSPVHNYQRSDATHLTLDPTQTTMNGFGGKMSGGKRSGIFRAIGTLNWRSPGLDFNDMGYIRQADIITETVELEYNINDPKGILRNYEVSLNHSHDWSFGGENLLDKIEFNFAPQFTNLWSLSINSNYEFNKLDTRLLRGGPALYINNNWNSDFYLQTNRTKDLVLGVGAGYQVYNDKISNSNNARFYVQWQLSDQFQVSLDIRRSFTADYHMFAGRVQDNNNIGHYIVGNIDRKTLEATLRVEYFITPELSVQFYGNPYASVGKYSQFREVTDSHSKNLDQRYADINILENRNNKYAFDINNDKKEDFTLKNPDFTFQEFSSNLVARWEYKAGSTLYLFWTNSRYSKSDEYTSSVSETVKNIWNLNEKAQNIFMLKFSYWFSI